MLVEASLSKDLMPGVFRVVIVLEKEEVALYEQWPFQFEIIDLPKRMLVPEREYVCPPLKDDEYNVRGRFVKGIFMAYCRTNGCPEEENPTPMQLVKEKLEEAVDAKFAVLRGRETKS